MSEAKAEAARRNGRRGGRPRVDREADEVTLTKPLCLKCRVRIGFDEVSGPAVIAGMGWVCWRCVRALLLAWRGGRLVPSVAQVVREGRPRRRQEVTA